MEEILRQIKIGLESYDEEVQQKIKFMLNRYSESNWKNLPEKEQLTNRIDIYRSLDSNDCGFACFQVEGKSESIIEVEDSLGYGENMIFDKWESVWDLDQTEEAIEKYGEIFSVELEVVYLSWFVKNWDIARSGKSVNFQYCLTENNSQSSFDLNLCQWDNYLDIYNYEKYDLSIPGNIPNPTSLRNRILLNFLGHDLENLTRTLKKGGHEIKFIYDDWSLKILDGEKGILTATNFKDSAERFFVQKEAVKKMIAEIEKLEQNGYLEI